MSSCQTLFEEDCLRCARQSDTYNEAFHASLDALQLFSHDLRILDANPAMAEICQFSRQELMDMAFDTLFPRVTDYNGVLSPDRLSGHCPLFGFSTRMHTRHRGDLPVDIAISPVPHLQADRPIFQARICRSGHPGPAAKGDKPKVGISRSSPWPEGRYLATNEAMSALLGYTPAELQARNTLMLLADPSTGGQLQKSLTQGEAVQEIPLTLTHKTGHEVQVTYTAKPLIRPDSGAAALDEIMVESLLASEDACQTSERLRAIGALAGGIAHSFNNILTGIYGNITLARMELSDQPHVGLYLKKAEDSMEEAVRLTRQLLTFARGGDPVKEKINPGPLFQDKTRFNLSGSNVRLDFKAQEGLWSIDCDKGQISQVIAHIVMNARQAMPRGGTLEVTMENTSLLKDNLLTIAKGAYLKIRFRDNGCGIAQSDLDRIFDPYFTTRPDSNGMGLSICHSIISKHQGHISVSSLLGSGTAITIYLPAAPTETHKEETMISEPFSQEKKARILVMDDEEHIRTITQKMLEKFGHEACLTGDGKEAVAAYAEALASGSPFDLVIMDLTVPGGMGGQEASRIILEMDPKASIVVSSGYSNDQVMANFKSYGLKGIIPKPFRLSELKTIVDGLIS